MIVRPGSPDLPSLPRELHCTNSGPIEWGGKGTRLRRSLEAKVASIDAYFHLCYGFVLLYVLTLLLLWRRGEGKRGDDGKEERG
jgi:hypothetical protein